jgi:hypothetical protein
MGRTRAEVISDINVALLAAGHSMRSASLALDLNPGYLSEFMRETDYSPEVLPEDVRLALATLLGVDEKIFRVGPVLERTVNSPEGIKGYSKRIPAANGDTSDRRNVHMRVDFILEELGRIKERLDQLEGRPGQAGNTKKPGPQ